MNRLYILFAMFGPVILLVSFSTDPPNGKTGAPGDSFCTECHVQPSQTIDGTIDLEGFPAAITPNQTYALTVVNRNTMGDAVRGGFQMTILGPTNTRAGTMESPSGSSAVQILSGRQYFEHHPAVTYPDSNVIRWTVLWTAPDLPDGSLVTYYLAGNICNGNFQNTGDRPKADVGSGTIMLSATETTAHIAPEVYPNPGRESLFVTTKDNPVPDGTITFYHATGTLAGKAAIEKGSVHVPRLSPGMYVIVIQVGAVVYADKWISM